MLIPSGAGRGASRAARRAAHLQRKPWHTPTGGLHRLVVVACTADGLEKWEPMKGIEDFFDRYGRLATGQLTIEIPKKASAAGPPPPVQVPVE